MIEQDTSKDDLRAEISALRQQLAEHEDEAKTLRSVLRSLVEDTTLTTGDGFFRALVRNFANALGIRCALVTECLGKPPTRARTIAFWVEDRFVENIEYELEGTPCERVILGETCYYRDHVRELFPADQDLADLGADSYLGIPLHDSMGQVIGHYAFLDDKPLKGVDRFMAVINVLAARTGAELERKRVEEDLRISEERFRVMADALPACISFVDSDLCYQFNNATYEEWQGIPRDEMAGRPVRDVLGEAAFEAARENMYRALAGETRSFDYLARFERSPARHVHVDYIPSRGADGQVAGFYALIYDITDRKETERELRDYQERLRALTSQVFLAEERERLRVAVGLHDGVLQTLTSIHMHLETLHNRLATSEHAGLARAADKLTTHALAETRSLTFELSPPVLHDLGLIPALNWMAERVRSRDDMISTVHPGDYSGQLPKDVELFLFQAIRELWRNATKHGKATRVDTHFDLSEGEVRICVVDDGAGFDQNRTPPLVGDKGFGLFSIRERIGYLGGRVEIESVRGEGTCITLTFPSPAGRSLAEPSLADPSLGAAPHAQQPRTPAPTLSLGPTRESG